jgi:hypothetical protein
MLLLATRAVQFFNGLGAKPQVGFAGRPRARRTPRASAERRIGVWNAWRPVLNARAGKRWRDDGR